MAGEGPSSGELRQLVSEALARFGVAGTVSVEAGRARLVGHGPTAEVELGALLEEWPGLSLDHRQKRALDVARRLSAERRAMTSTRPAEPSDAAPPWLGRAALFGGIALVLSLGVTGYRLIRSGAPVAPSARVVRDYDAYERERQERAARVCEATRSRIMRGASVGPSDVEGFVVELWALESPDKPPLVASEAVGQFIRKGPSEKTSRVTWSGAPAIAGIDGPGTGVEVSEANLAFHGELRMRGIRLVLGGRYVTPFFDEGQRGEFVRFARAFTDALGADYGALYARCASGQSHHVGSWFLGPTPGGAVTSLVFFMGTFADHPDVRSSLLVPEGATAADPAFAFTSVAKATAPLKKARVMTILGAEGGMIAGLDGQTSAITFPFRDSNRAARSSREIARELGIGADR